MLSHQLTVSHDKRSGFRHPVIGTKALRDIAPLHLHHHQIEIQTNGSGLLGKILPKLLIDPQQQFLYPREGRTQLKEWRPGIMEERKLLSDSLGGYQWLQSGRIEHKVIAKCI